MTDLVIAYYNEKEYLNTFLAYANKYNYNIILYNKGNSEINAPLPHKIRKLDNIGQATHTYLYHIIQNYDNLNDITIFMLGSAFRGDKKARKAHWILQNANSCRGFLAQHIWLSDKSDYDFELPYYDIINYNSNRLERVKTEMVRANIIPLGKWIESNTEFTLPNKQFYRASKCMFAVTKEVILKKPLSYYKKIIKQLETNSRNLEVIHFFENNIYHHYIIY